MPIHRRPAPLLLLAGLLALQPIARTAPDRTADGVTPGPAAEATPYGAPEANPEAGGGPFDLYRAGEEDPLARVDREIDRLLQLGRIQESNGEYRAAARTLDEALARVREHHGIWDQRNVNLLADLASVRSAMGDPGEALGLYEQAVHVNRINQGLHDPSQLDLLDAMTELHVRRDEWEEANHLQEYAYYVRTREHGAESPELLPGLYDLAEWYRRTGAIFHARALYENAVSIIDNAQGPLDRRLIEPLRGIAGTYRMERHPEVTGARRSREPEFSVSTGSVRDPLSIRDPRMQLNPYSDGEDALARVVAILEADPDSTSGERAEAQLELADWYLVFDKWSSAIETYARARQELLESGWDPARVEQLFEEPRPLVFPLPAPPSPPSSATDLVERRGYVDLQYDVSSRGRIDHLQILAEEPEDMMNFRLRKALRAARFRPRFVDGEPVETAGVEYRHEFIYREPAPAPDEGGGDPDPGLREPSAPD
jgi:tetratricopeptide (TPR) repeat protein